ncbi:allantoate permease [Penicillium angulare]|uniref:allantoate permease n=1 Tax=Penicillium angulare TaxID=116970 RepID=UPI0025416463|nr:allantoate permease [Penicillium angulare]KAJ5279833.1 allantoate permease [Penicillium angulare]
MAADTEANVAQQQELVKPIKSWKGYLWDTWDLPSDQRWLLFKLDAFVLTFASIGYFLKNLDLQNVTNAYLSGMEEDLEMYGNQLLEVGWGIATMCMSSVKSYKALYALRFIVGIFESGFYPGIHYLLGSWYTPQEIGKRAMTFWLAGSIGQLFSGFLQAAAYTNLDGVDGRAGWRWLFIIDGIITLPLALAGFIFFPNLPQSGKKTWWTSEEEHVLSVKRMQVIGRAGEEPWTKAKARRIFLSWHTWLLPLLYIVWNNGYPQVGMGYWLKSFNATPAPVPGKTFTVAQIDNLPLVTTGIFIAMAFVWGWLSDGPMRGSRWPFIHIGAVITIVFCVLLRQMPLYTNIDGRMTVYWLSFIGTGAGPLILSWANEICSADTEKRALVVAMANDLAYVVQAVAPNFVWKTTDFPAAKDGYLWAIILQILSSKGILELYLKKPNHVVIAGVRDPGNASSQALAQTPRADGTELHVIKIDATSATDAAAAVKELATKNINHIDILLANAGICLNWPKVSEVKIEDIQTHIDVNVYGFIYLYQAFRDILKIAKNPKWVTIEMNRNFIPARNASYAPSKLIQHWYTKAISAEDEWLTAFPVEPGWVQTEMGNRGAETFGMEKAALTVEESAKGVVQVVDVATRQTHSGRLFRHDGGEEPW